MKQWPHRPQRHHSVLYRSTCRRTPPGESLTSYTTRADEPRVRGRPRHTAGNWSAWGSRPPRSHGERGGCDGPSEFGDRVGGWPKPVRLFRADFRRLLHRQMNVRSYASEPDRGRQRLGRGVRPRRPGRGLREPQAYPGRARHACSWRSRSEKLERRSPLLRDRPDSAALPARPRTSPSGRWSTPPGST